MIDVLTVHEGDTVEYGPFLCSPGLEGDTSYGIYQGFTFWSPDGRPVELWLNLLNPAGLKIRVRASQVVEVKSHAH